MKFWSKLFGGQNLWYFQLFCAGDKNLLKFRSFVELLKTCENFAISWGSLS